MHVDTDSFRAPERVPLFFRWMRATATVSFGDALRQSAQYEYQHPSPQNSQQSLRTLGALCARRVVGLLVHGSHNAYVSKVSTAAFNAYLQGYLRKADLGTILNQAKPSNVCTFGPAGQSCDPAAP